MAHSVPNLAYIGMGLVAITTVMVAARIYQLLFAWTKGLDSFSPEFQTYWWNLVLAEWGIEGTSAALLWGTNSNDGIDSPEWERRHNWSGFRSNSR